MTLYKTPFGMKRAVFTTTPLLIEAFYRYFCVALDQFLVRVLVNYFFQVPWYRLCFGFNTLNPSTLSEGGVTNEVISTQEFP